MKRLSALMLALAMMLGAFGAFAESMPVNRTQQLLNEGKALEQTLQITLDEAAVKGLIPLFAGSEMPEEAGMLVSSLISAVNKLRVRTLAANSGYNTVVYTDKGEIAHIDANTDEKAGETTVVTDVLPGYAFFGKSDPELNQLIQKIKSNPEMLAKLGEKYTAISAKWFEESVAPGMKTEEGEFVESDLSYGVKMTSTLTAEQAQGLVKALLAEAKKDDVLKDLLNGFLMYAAKANTASKNSSAGMPATADEAFEQLEKKLMESDPEASKANALNLTVLKNKEGKGAAVILNSDINRELGKPALYLSIASQPAENGHSLRVLLMQKNFGGEEQPKDWDEIKTIAMMGGDPSLTSVSETIDYVVKDGKAEATGFFNIGVNGLPITLKMLSSENLDGEYASDMKIALAFVSPDPLLTIDIHTAAAGDKMPVKAETEKAVVINVEDLNTETGKAEAQQMLGGALAESLPQLLERMNAALPDEMPVFTQMIQSAMQAAQQGAEMPAESMETPAETDGQHATLGN